MENKDIINIIVVGTGGQGVVWLSNQIRSLAKLNGFSCVGATFKGGAQRMGTVYAELRLQKLENTEIISSQIPNHKVDILIGLEPWETLRMSKRCLTNTKVIVHNKTERLYVERHQEINTNPIVELKRLFNKIEVVENENNLKLNQLMLHQSIDKNILPFNPIKQN